MSEHDVLEFPLTGPAGEPVDLWRTLLSHGVGSLLPSQIDSEARTLTVTLALPGYGPRTVTVARSRQGYGLIQPLQPLASEGERAVLLDRVRHLLRLEADLSPFYAAIAADPDLSWVAAGAGRMTRSATVFEDIVKTICTTNCTWSATIRMVTALVQHLGEPALGSDSQSPLGRVFPTPARMAEADGTFYREVAKAGYRGAYLRKVAEMAAGGTVDLEGWGRASREDLPDDELRRQLLALPGVGPYAADHIMMMLGRYARPILDSWTRPTYARLIAQDRVTDAEIVERFARYGDHAGLAFWLFITRDWVDDGTAPAPSPQ